MYSAARKRLGMLAVLIACVAFLTTSAFAQLAAKSPKATSKEEVAVPDGQPAATDAKGAKLRPPTREEVQALIEGMKPALDTSTEGLTPVRQENGALSVDLQGRFQSTTVAKIEADGTISQRCVHSAEEAKTFLTSPQTKNAGKGKQPPAPARKPKPVLEEK